MRGETSVPRQFSIEFEVIIYLEGSSGNLGYVYDPVSDPLKIL